MCFLTVRFVILPPFANPRGGSHFGVLGLHFGGFWSSGAGLWWLLELRGRALDFFGRFLVMGLFLRCPGQEILPPFGVPFGIPNLKSRKQKHENSVQEAVWKKCGSRTSPKRQNVDFI